MQRYSDFLEHRTQYNENLPVMASLSSPDDAGREYQRFPKPASTAPATADPNPARKVPELVNINAPSAAAPSAAAAKRQADSDYVANFLASNPSSNTVPVQSADYVPAHRPPSRGWGGVFSNLRAGLRGAASSAYTVPQAFKSAAVGSDEETRMAAKNPRWTGAYGGATGSAIRAYRVADEDLAQAEMREIDSLRTSTKDPILKAVLGRTIQELQKDSQARLKALTDKDMAARKANPIKTIGPKNDAWYADHNQWYYNDDMIELDEGWGRDLYRHAASGLAGTSSFLKNVIPRTLGGFTGLDREKVQGPFRGSKAYGGFMGAVQQARNAAQESLHMADIRAAESIVSRSSHPYVIKQLVNFIRAKKGLPIAQNSIEAALKAYPKWKILKGAPDGPYDGPKSINDIIKAQTGVAPAGGDAVGRLASNLKSIEKEDAFQKGMKANQERLAKQGGAMVSFEPQGDKSRFTSLDTTLPTPIGDGKERGISVGTGTDYGGGISVGAGDPTAMRSSATLTTKRESRNYSRSLESIYNESFLDSIGKGIKSGYDYMTGSQKKQDKVPQEMTENQRKIYNAMLDINKMSADQYESMSEKNKAKAFRYAMDQVCDINGIPHINWLINMNDEDKIIAWKNARRRFNPILSSLGY